MATMIGIIGIISNLIIVLTFIQGRKIRNRNIALDCAMHELKIKNM